MLLAGLGIDLQALVKHLNMVMRLTIIPTILEVTITAVIGYYALKMPWSWAILMG